MNSWLSLLIAGLCEVAWAVGLKYTVNFSKLVPSIVTIFAMVLSILFLNYALKTIPLGVAYAVWTGIGVMGTVVFGMFLFGDTVSFIRVVSLLCIILGIIGCRLSM